MTSAPLRSLPSLPPELQTLILAKLDTRSLLTCRQVCQTFNAIVQENVYFNKDFHLLHHAHHNKSSIESEITHLKANIEETGFSFLVFALQILPTCITELFIKLFPSISQDINKQKLKEENIALLPDYEFALKSITKSIKGDEFIYSLFGGLSEYSKIPILTNFRQEITRASHVTPDDMIHPIMRLPMNDSCDYIIFKLENSCGILWKKDEDWIYEDHQIHDYVFQGTERHYMTPYLEQIIVTGTYTLDASYGLMSRLHQILPRK